MKIIKHIFSSKSFQHFNIVLLETVITKGINFYLIVLIARALGPENYGIYSLATVSVLFLASFCDFGMENTAVRFSVKYQNEREWIFGLYVLCKSSVLIVLLFILIFCPQLIAGLLNKTEIEGYRYFILGGVLCEGILFVITTHLRSLERFYSRAFINIGVYLLRLIVTLYVLKSSLFDIRIIVVIFTLSGLPFVGAYAGILFKCIKKFFSQGIPKNVVSEMFRYGKWMLIGSISVNLIIRIDFFMVTYFLTYKEIGTYNSAFQFMAPLSMIPLVFGTVFLPKVSRFDNISQIKAFTKKCALLGGIVCALTILLIPFARPLIVFFLGKEFSAASAIFQILLISYVVSITSGIFDPIFYASEQPEYLIIGKYLKLVTSIVCMVILVPRLGMRGAAWSRVFSEIAAVIITSYFLYRMLRNKKRTEYRGSV